MFVFRFGPRTALSSGHASDSNLDRLGRDLELGETKVDPRPNSTPRRPAAQPREAPPQSTDQMTQFPQHHHPGYISNLGYRVSSRILLSLPSLT